MHCAPMDWPLIQTGKPATPAQRTTMSTGNGLMPPLDAAAQKAGVQYLLEHKMTALYRENGTSGRVVGVAADHKGTKRQHPCAQGGHHRHRRLTPAMSISAACSTRA